MVFRQTANCFKYLVFSFGRDGRPLGRPSLIRKYNEIMFGFARFAGTDVFLGLRGWSCNKCFA